MIEKDEIHCYGAVPQTLKDSIPISNYTNALVSKIVCGNSHCLILFTDSTLYGFGGNEEGQLGINITSEEQKYINDITQINFTVPGIDNFTVEDIAAGDTFSIILINSNNRTHLVKFGISQADKYRVNLNNVNVVTLEETNIHDGAKIKKISVFGKRKMFLTETNEIYLGGMDFMSSKIDGYINFETINNNIISINLGANHCIIMDEKKDIYGLGDNTYGELGPNKLSLNKFTLMKFEHLNSPIAKIACGARHTLILLENGELYCLGDNSEGQCFGYTARISFPIQVTMDLKERIVDCYCGYTHNLIVLENGDVMTWGDASGGKLGYNEEHFSQTTPKVIFSLKQKCVNKVCLGFQMSVITTGKYEPPKIEQ